MQYRVKRQLSSIFTTLLLAFGQLFPFLTVLSNPVYADAPISADVDLDQMHNGSAASPSTPPTWVNGNAGSSNSHLIEGYSQSYRAVMTDLPIGEPITLTIGYDIKHSGAHAIDYLTQYQRLDDHSYFGHSAEVVDPTDGVTGITDGSAPSSTFAIPAPSSSGSPVAGEPTASFNSLPAGERVMSMWNGTINSMAYNTQGNLAVAASATTINVTFTPNSSTAILAWGGHLGSKLDWGIGNSAGGISGSPYHMRLESWFADVDDNGDNDLKNLGNTDKSLSADAVISPATITVVKDVVPNDSSTWDFNLNLSADNSLVGTATGIGDGGSYTFTNLQPDTYDLSEVTDGSYTTSVACVDEDSDPIGTGSTSSVELDLPEGEDVTCTFTNEINPGSITVDKITNPTGSTQLFDFDLTGDATGSTSLADGDAPYIFNDLLPGSYSLTEDAVTDWDPTSASCIDENQVPVSGPANITLTAGQNIYCTFTNTQLGKVIVEKQTNPDGNTSEFGFYFDGGDLFTLTDGEQEEFANLAPGAYSIEEAASEGWELTGVVCDDNDSGSDGEESLTATANVAAGETVTCVFTNERLPLLTVYKELNIQYDGDALITDFELYVDAQLVISGVTNIFPPGDYLVTEIGQDGYLLTSIIGACDEQGNITLNYGDDVSCTLTNSDQPATLILVKNLPNDNGGTATEGNFNVYIDAVQSSWGSHEVSAGTYTVSEDTLPGYTASSWGGDCDAQGNVTLDVGETKTCSITNDDEPATLILTKILPNDNGGTATESDFNVYIDDVLSSWGSHQVDAGLYTVSEDTLPGYTPFPWGGDCNSEGQVFLQPGETRTCSILNDDETASLTLVKVLPNDNGGNATEADFNVYIDAVQSSWGFHYVDAGSYTVSEDTLAGYTASSWGGDCDAQGNVTLLPGESKTCTITNDDDAGTLIIQKIVVNDNGGNNTPDDFWFTVNDWEIEQFEDDGHNEYPVDSGYYTIIESQPEGYGVSYENCSEVFVPVGGSATCTITNDDISPTVTLYKEVINDNGGTAGENDFGLTVGGNSVESGENVSVLANTDIVLNEAGLFGYSFVSLTGDEGCPSELGGTVNLSEGENISCVITNDDIAPNLTVIKHVINNSEGTAVAGDFTMTVSGLNVSSSLFAGSEAGTTVSLDAGEYLVSELKAAGYTVSYSSDCDGIIGVGESKICTVTNNDEDILGAETELPETGSDPLNIAVALSALQVGLFLRRKVKKS